jgi:hypothetical protein
LPARESAIYPRTLLSFSAWLLMAALFLACVSAPSPRQVGEAFIVDRKGERWPLDQAATLGFEPRRFQFGIGRTAFTPLGPGDVQKPPAAADPEMRVVGFMSGGEAVAGSVASLSRHETANLMIGGSPVTLAY